MAEVTESLLRTYAESDGLTLAELVHKKEVSPLELVEAAIVTIEKLNPTLNAVIHKHYDMARQAATDVAGDAPFAGVPYLLKELATSWKGSPNTNSSFYLKGIVSDFDAEVVTRIKKAGFLLVGKSNAPENGWSISTEPKLYGATVNPWRADLTAGGSSGGSCAAVASRMVPVAESSDAAGSIRVPASCCGVLGLKPSRGRVTMAPYADAWHGCAYFLANTRTVRDTAAYLDAVAGALPGDPYQPPAPEKSWLELSRRAPKKLRIAYSVTPPDGRGIDPEVRQVVLDTAKRLENLGHTVEEHNMALDADNAWKTYTNMSCVQTAAVFDWLSAVVGRPATKDDVEPITWAIIERGRATNGIRHISDVEAVRQMGRAIAMDLDAYDIFLTPTLTHLPRPVGFYDMSMTDLDAYNDLWSDGVFMFPFDMSGQPAMSIPVGMSKSGVPIGVQAVGRYGDEATILALATVLEQEMPWAGRRPTVSA
ncbi:amidase [Mesorhizobium sp. IMUNJ 23232]|uniref:amidase n=1 Tax=Mesorhizobium sp. IMUNJ 23232 TaxID=3376064 RepID=UPI0037901370